MYFLYTDEAFFLFFDFHNFRVFFDGLKKVLAGGFEKKFEKMKMTKKKYSFVGA